MTNELGIYATNGKYGTQEIGCVLLASDGYVETDHFTFDRVGANGNVSWCALVQVSIV